MSRQLTSKLEELNRLWVDVSVEALRRIPGLCNEIATLAENGGLPVHSGLRQLKRIAVLAGCAGNRASECLAIETRTGVYSAKHGLEQAPRVVTVDWEG